MSAALHPLWMGTLVAVGAGAGAVLRWQAGVWLSPRWGGFPLGTLAVNLIGGLLVGMALAWLARHPHDGWRLLLITGFLGGLTTFSAFSAESLGLLESGRWSFALLHSASHVAGALACAALGMRLMRTWLA